MIGLERYGISIVEACRLTGYPRSSFNRHRNPAEPKAAPIRQADRHQPNALSTTERARIVEIVNSVDYAHLSVSQTFHRAWDAGLYVGSCSSWYRVLGALGQVSDRRRQATGKAREIPELVTTGPNQVWSWDITKIRGPRTGVWFHFYVLMDIFSRRIVGWRVEAYEEGVLAQAMIEDAIANNDDIAPDYLHSDNGAAMTSQPVSELLTQLGISKSLNRPHVSNDNPYSEALFKTYKYEDGFPGHFDTVEEAHAYCGGFTYEYNTNHHHSGIGWHTPDNVHYNRTDTITAARARILDDNQRANPGRYAHPPEPPALPERVAINDPGHKTLTTLSHTG